MPLARYAFFFGYASGAWARMINSPGDRTVAVRQLARLAGLLSPPTGCSAPTMGSSSPMSPTRSAPPR